MKGLAPASVERIGMTSSTPSAVPVRDRVREGSEDAGPLLVAHRNGDGDAFAKLVERYRRPVFSYLVHCGVPEPDRDDLFQEIFVRVHRRAPSYQASRPLHPWLFTVVANAVRSYFRTKKRLFLFAGPPSPNVRDEAPDGEAVASANETAAWLERAIQGLPLPQREVLLLATVENLPLNDIASILDLPLNTVKTHLRRARLRLVDGYERRTATREVHHEQ
jgi:RNA polymerase sigma-70 factor, ECF subfamily